MASKGKDNMAEGEDFIPKLSKAYDQRQERCFTARPSVIIGISLCFVIIYTVALTLGLLLPRKNDPGRHDVKKMTIAVGAVSSDHETCSEIGREFLSRGGSAVDATIATLLCNGLMSPHSMGIGGGSFIAIYDAKTKKAQTIDARETAPSGLTYDLNTDRSSRKKVLSIGIPGEIMGYWEAHKNHGRLPWKDLFLPAIELAERGHYLSDPTSQAFARIRSRGVDLANDTEFCRVYCGEAGQIAPAGTLIKRPHLARTLRGIAENGPTYLHEGPVAEEIVREIQDKGGVLTKKDLAEYVPVVGEGISVDLGNVTLLTLGAPSSGPIVGLMLNILKGLGLSRSSLATPKGRARTYHILMEALKLSYGDRWQLADPDFVPDVKTVVKKMISGAYADFLRGKLNENHTQTSSYYANISYPAHDHGTAHVSVIAPDGSAVSVTSTINFYFGSTIMSKSTGIIWNNEMTDFSGDNPRNFVEPRKRPLSSMVPAIFVDKSGHVRLVIGGAGGFTITPVVAQVSAFMLYIGDTSVDAVRRKRVFYKTSEDALIYEKGFPQDTIASLKHEYGHKIKQHSGSYLAVVQAVDRCPVTGEIRGYSDYRKNSGRAKFLTQEVNVTII